MRLTIHVNDFAVIGPKGALQWLLKGLQSKFELKSAFLGPDAGEQKEAKYLNRTLRWTSTGITYEHDSKHVLGILKGMGMED